MEVLPQHQVLTALMRNSYRTRRRVVRAVWCHQRAMSQVLMSVPLPWRNVPGQRIPKMIKAKFLSQQGTPIKSWQHLDQKRSSPEESCQMDTDDTEGERATRRARVWHMWSRWSCSCTGRQRKRRVMRLTMTCFVDPELVIREKEWVNHKMDEGNFDP